MESSIRSMLVIWRTATVNASALGHSSFAQSGEVEDEMDATVETGEGKEGLRIFLSRKHRRTYSTDTG